jgi:hypothetical protein
LSLRTKKEIKVQKQTKLKEILSFNDIAKERILKEFKPRKIDKIVWEKNRKRLNELMGKHKNNPY